MAETTPAAPLRSRHAAEAPASSALRTVKKLLRRPGRDAAAAPSSEAPAQRTSLPLRRAVTAIAAAALPAGLFAMATPASAASSIDGTGNRYFITNDMSPSGTLVGFGHSGDDTYVGDFLGQGRDTFAVRRGSVLHIAASATDTRTVRTVGFGRASDDLLVGDWNGDGTDTFAVRRGNVYHFTNNPNGGAAEFTVGYGTPRDQVLVGDWNADGRDTLGIRRGNTFDLSNDLRRPATHHIFQYGRASDDVLVGDFNGNNQDTIGVHRGKTFHLRNSLSSGGAHSVVDFGTAQDAPFVGNWNGSGADTIGVRRPDPAPQPVQRRAESAPANPHAVTGVWARLAQCESGGNPRIVSRNGLYYGLYQFSLPTWRSVGGTGLPSNASPEEQTQRAQMLQARSGWGQWPACSRQLGLR